MTQLCFRKGELLMLTALFCFLISLFNKFPFALIAFIRVSVQGHTKLLQTPLSVFMSLLFNLKDSVLMPVFTI